MKLEDLLDGDESSISHWLKEEDLIHECNCGYTVYDPDDVSSTVQDRWGSKRCDEIHDWSHSLADQFGWLFLESSRPEHGIYHCQYCEDSEWSFFCDLQRIAAPDRPEDRVATTQAKEAKQQGEPLIVYVDESYNEEFPRKPDGSLAYAALIIPESKIEALEAGVKRILSESYRGTPPSELKYSKIAKRAGLLKRVGSGVTNLLSAIPEAKVIGIFVPRSGFFGEQRRSIQAMSHYRGVPPAEAELKAVDSEPSVEAAMRTAANHLACVIAGCVSSYIASQQGASARIVFDPRSKEQDEALLEDLKRFLSMIPVDIPLFVRGNAVVTVYPKNNIETVGGRVNCEMTQTSHDSLGLQLADFLAGDIRAFFNEVPELLDEAETTELLVNRKVLFPEAYRVSQISKLALEKVHKRTEHARSFLPIYRHRLVHNLLSYYTRNGQMRNLNTETGEVFDLMD